jgi:phosphoglycolate phosphatase
MASKPDSLIFDMDGTLWDATDSYVLAWNEGLKKYGINQSVDRPLLDSMMGLERNKVYKKVFSSLPEAEYDLLYKTINEAQDGILPKLGGILYPGVYEGFQLLSKQYKVFIVSNCPANTIKQFIAWAKVENFITDEMAHGVNYMPKNHNVKLLIDKYYLKAPIYIGDTDSDRLQSELAGLPFVLVTYGFGTSENYFQKFNTFGQLTEYFINLK